VRLRQLQEIRRPSPLLRLLMPRTHPVDVYVDSSRLVIVGLSYLSRRRKSRINEYTISCGMIKQILHPTNIINKYYKAYKT
jgi:hypothetical protein